MLKKIINGIFAGMSISIGGAAFLMCYNENKYVGALLFCVGLLSVCWFGFSLYTGKIGLIIESHSKEDISALLLGLLGNTVAAIACGYLLAYAIPTIREVATSLAAAKLAQGYLNGFIRAIFCGILIYVAVYVYGKKKSVLGVILGIPAFIVSGYEHSIADMFYFAASGVASWQAFGYIWIVIIGNSVGGLLIPALQLLGNLSFGKKAQPVDNSAENPEISVAEATNSVAEAANSVAEAVNSVAEVAADNIDENQASEVETSSAEEA